MTEAQRIATKQMLQETASAHPADKPPPRPTSSDEQYHGVPVDQTVKSGTHVLPMPSTSSDVAGMPRSGRAHAQPGEPGIPAPEEQLAIGKKV